MKYMFIAVLLLLSLASLSAMAETGVMSQNNAQENQSVNSPTSVMSNTQINGGVSHDSYGGGVNCSRTTWQVGAVGIANSNYQTGTQLYAGVTGTFGDEGRCKDAANAQIYLTRMKQRDLEQHIKRTNLTHAEEIKKQRLLYADLLAKVCENQHDKVVALDGSVLDSECDTYSTISHHSKEYDKTKFHRVSGHGH